MSSPLSVIDLDKGEARILTCEGSELTISHGPDNRVSVVCQENGVQKMRGAASADDGCRDLPPIALPWGWDFARSACAAGSSRSSGAAAPARIASGQN